MPGSSNAGILAAQIPVWVLANSTSPDMWKSRKRTISWYFTIVLIVFSRWSGIGEVYFLLWGEFTYRILVITISFPSASHFLYLVVPIFLWNQSSFSQCWISTIFYQINFAPNSMIA